MHCHAGRWMASFLSKNCFIPSNNFYCNTSTFFLNWFLLRKQQIFQNLQAQRIFKTRTMLKLNIFEQNVLCYCSYQYFQKFSSFYFHFDNEKWHLSVIQRSCTLRFSTITHSSTHNSRNLDYLSCSKISAVPHLTKASAEGKSTERK